MRRVTGYHDIRLDGISDLLSRARGASVFDIGCNRGLVGFEFANNGAKMVHGCDIYEQGIFVARELFCDLRNCESKFELVDLTGGADAMKEAFGICKQKYDIVVMLATYHKLRRVMKSDALSDLMKYFAQTSAKYFAWRGYEDELEQIDTDMKSQGLKRIHTSQISESLKEIKTAAIWSR